jgi:hypothetical protein
MLYSGPTCCFRDNALRSLPLSAECTTKNARQLSSVSSLFAGGRQRGSRNHPPFHHRCSCGGGGGVTCPAATGKADAGTFTPSTSALHGSGHPTPRGGRRAGLAPVYQGSTSAASRGDRRGCRLCPGCCCTLR